MNHFKNPKVKYDYKYLKQDDLGRVPLENLYKVSPLLNEFNPMTYSIFLAMNDKVLTEQEKTYYQCLIRAMFDSEKKTMEEVSKVMKLREDYQKMKEEEEDSL